MCKTTTTTMDASHNNNNTATMNSSVSTNNTTVVSKSRIADLKATLRGNVRKSVSFGVEDAALRMGGSGRISQLKAKLRRSITDVRNLKKSWNGKDWEDDEQRQDYNYNPPQRGASRGEDDNRLTKSVFQESYAYWTSKAEQLAAAARQEVPKDLQPKDKILGKTKKGVSKRKIAGLKGLMKNAVLDTLGSTHHSKMVEPITAAAAPKTGPLTNNHFLNIMVQASKEKLTSDLFQIQNKAHRRQLDKAANTIQRFARYTLHVLTKYRIDKRYLKKDLKDCKKRKKEELADIEEYIRQEKEKFRLQLQAEYAEVELEGFQATTQSLQEEIAEVKASNQALHAECKQLAQENDLLELQANNPERRIEVQRLEQQIQGLEADRDDWKRLRDYYTQEVTPTEALIESTTQRYYAQKRQRRFVKETMKRVLQAMEDVQADQKVLEKSTKQSNKRDNQYQKLKQARAWGEYPVPEEDDLREREKVVMAMLQALRQTKSKVEPTPTITPEEPEPEPEQAAAETPKTTSQPVSTTPASPKKLVPTLTGQKPTGNAPTDFVSGRAESFEDLYQLGDKLGEGEFGAVYKCTHKLKKGTDRAVKILDKAHMDEWEYDQVIQEFQMLDDIHNPNVIKVYEFYDTDDQFYIVQELASGGELFDELIAKGRLAEQDVATLMRSILSCVEHLAQDNIVHRDLNLENILLDSSNEKDYGKLKVIDFGLAAKCPPGERLYEMAGKARYIAPEVLGDHGYGLKSDVWICGVTAYTLLAGFHPFEAEMDSDVYPLIVEGYFDFKDEVWETVSDQAKDFVSQLLTYKEEDRPMAAEALKHPWFTANDSGLTFSKDIPAATMWTATAPTTTTPAGKAQSQSLSSKKERRMEAKKAEAADKTPEAEKTPEPISSDSQEKATKGKKKSTFALSDTSDDDDSSDPSSSDSEEKKTTTKKKKKITFAISDTSGDDDSSDLSSSDSEEKKTAKKKKKKKKDTKKTSFFDDDASASCSMGDFGTIGSYGGSGSALGLNPLGGTASSFDYDGNKDDFDYVMNGSTRQKAPKIDLMDVSQLDSSQLDIDASSRSRLSKKERRRQKKLKRERKEQEETEALLASRSNKIMSDDSFNSMLFSSDFAGSRRSSAPAGKLGASLLKGAVKDVMGRQRRVSALVSLVEGPDDEGPPPLVDMPAEKEAKEPKKKPAASKSEPLKKKKSGVGASKLQGAVKNVMKGQRRASALMSLIDDMDEMSDSEESEPESLGVVEEEEPQIERRKSKKKATTSAKLSKKTEKKARRESALFSIISGL